MFGFRGHCDARFRSLALGNPAARCRSLKPNVKLTNGLAASSYRPFSLAALVSKSPAPPNAYPFYTPRFWHGMRLGDWLKLVFEHRCRIHPLRWVMAIGITMTAAMNSLLGFIQNLLYGAQIRATKVDPPPVFIVGHWRSGTTLLHELMVKDPQFGSPSTYECFAPHHFLLTRGLMSRFGGWLLPKKRPMDNMAAAWDRPQEDEFAICTLGVPTPYRRMAFPNDPPCDQEYLNLEDVPADALEQWKNSLMRFVQMLAWDKKRRIILKSPPHTGRVGVLHDMFPGAKFIHLSRDPASVYPSAQRLWRSLDEAQGMQAPRHENVIEFVHDTFERLYQGFHNQRERLPEGSIIDVRYETLVEDPIGELERIYDELDLGDFEAVRDGIEEYLGEQRDYKTTRHPDIPDDERIEVDRRWGFYMDRYGYERLAGRV